MAVTMILELPNIREHQSAITPRFLIADLPLEHLVRATPPIESAASNCLVVEDGEPTWEDAAWQ